MIEKCGVCGAQKLLMEQLGDRVKTTCMECGNQQVSDASGRYMVTGENAAPPKNKLLTEDL